MNHPTEIIKKTKKEPLKIKIPAIPTWEGFDEIIDFLVEEYNALVLEKNDALFERLWILAINEKKIELIHEESDGNYLQASEEGEEIILEIGQDLEERLMGDLLDIDDAIQGRVYKTRDSAMLTFWHNHQDLTKEIYNTRDSAMLTVWHNDQDLTEKIYKALQNQQSNLKEVQLFGAPWSYSLLMVPLKGLDKLLKNIKMMDKSDLKKHWG